MRLLHYYTKAACLMCESPEDCYEFVCSCWAIHPGIGVLLMVVNNFPLK